MTWLDWTALAAAGAVLVAYASHRWAAYDWTLIATAPPLAAAAALRGAWGSLLLSIAYGALAGVARARAYRQPPVGTGCESTIDQRSE